MSNSLRIGDFTVEPSLNSLSGPTGTVRLEPKVMLVLLCLAKHGNEVVGKERLMRAAWPDTFVTDDVLTRAISELRRVFGDDVRDPRFIQTIPKSGYRLIAPVHSAGHGDNEGATTAQIALADVPRGTDGLAAEQGARVSRPGLRVRTWLIAIAAAAAAMLLALVGYRLTASPSAKVLRSIQLTVRGHVASPTIGEAEFFPAIATDGGRIYFSRSIGNQYTLAQASAAGGEVAAIATPFRHALLLHLSADGSRLLVREYDHSQIEGPLWAIPTTGGAPLRLGDILAHDASWSPDGKRLVFARGEELHLAGADGMASRSLVTIPGRAFWLRWSPDGARLRFTLGNTQGTERSLWEVSANGDGLQPLAIDRGEHDLDCCGEWSADGRYFFFRRFREDRADIWVVRDSNGLFAPASPARITSGAPHYLAAVPTGDGRLLAIGAHTYCENLRFDAAGRGFSPEETVDCAGWFAHSRDGAWRAYVQYRLTHLTLWRSRNDGTERRQLTQPPLRLLLPRWSPDGTRIAFMGRLPGRPWKIYTIAADGGEPHPILEGDRAESDPDWSPDGTSVMFSRPPDYVAEASAPKAIHLLDLRTKELSTLPGSEGLFGSRWSPSGRYVAAVTLDQSALRLFDWSTQRWTELGRFKTVHNPVWSRDERHLYFEVVDEASIYRLRIGDRNVEKVVGMEDASKPAYWFCVFQGLASDDAPLISCHRDDPEIYALHWEMH